MISFEPTEEQRLIQETVAEFAKTTLAPRAREFERAGAVADDVCKTAQEMGLALAAVPEQHGGQGLGLLSAVLINEALAYGDAAAPFGLPGFGSFLVVAEQLCSEAQATQLIEPFSSEQPTYGAVAWSERKAGDKPGFSTLARSSGDGWELTGAKCFVGNAALASHFIVFAQVDAEAGWDGVGAFLLSRDNPGLKVEDRHATLGIDCGSFGSLKLEAAKVSAAERLQPKGSFARATLRAFARYSLLVAARQVGLARSAFDIAREYCDIRQAFGKPIGHFQAVAFTLADRHMDAETASALVQRAAWAWDAGKKEEKCLLLSAQAVAHAHEVAMRCADDAVQLHGGAGFMRDVIVEKMMRDAKQLALVGMTAEQMDQLATAIELRGELDPALVLPTPESQAIFT